MKLLAVLLALPLLAAANPIAGADPVGDRAVAARDAAVGLAARDAIPEAEAEAEADAEPGVTTKPNVLAKRDRTCALTGSDVRYRRCPHLSCDAVGQYGAKGTKVSFHCWTVGDSVNGYSIWDKNSNGYYVSEYYVDRNCAYQLPQC